MILVLLFSFEINFGLEGKIPSDLKLVDTAFSVRVHGTKSPHFMNSHWIFLFSRVETTWAPKGWTGSVLVQTHLAVARTDEGSASGSCSVRPPVFVSGLHKVNRILGRLTSTTTTVTALLGVIVHLVTQSIGIVLPSVSSTVPWQRSVQDHSWLADGQVDYSLPVRVKTPSCIMSFLVHSPCRSFPLTFQSRMDFLFLWLSVESKEQDGAAESVCENLSLHTCVCAPFISCLSSCTVQGTGSSDLRCYSLTFCSLRVVVGFLSSFVCCVYVCVCVCETRLLRFFSFF